MVTAKAYSRALGFSLVLLLSVNNSAFADIASELQNLAQGVEQTVTQTAEAVYENLPPTDLPHALIGTTYMVDKSIESLDLAVDSIQTTTVSGTSLTLTTPAELKGLATGKVTDGQGITTYQIPDRSYHNGQNIGEIAIDMVDDFIDNIVDFYSGEANWRVVGLCSKKTSYTTYQRYTWPAMWMEQSSDMLRGKYMENLFIRPLFKRFLENGPMTPLTTLDGVEMPGDVFEVADHLAPYDINRVKTISEPKGNGDQKNTLERVADSIDNFGRRKSIPEVTNDIDGFHGNQTALKRGEVTEFHRNVESYRFSGLANLTNIPVAFLGNCHHTFIAEQAFPFIHRTDNPLIYPYTRSPTYVDLLLLWNLKPEKIDITTTPGNCVAEDLKNAKGLVGALGVYPLDSRFGTLGKVNPGVAGLATLLTANTDNCMQAAGSIYPLTNRISGGKNFNAAFFTKFMRMDRLSNLYQPGGKMLPSFHQYKNNGSRFEGKLQIKESSFGSSNPRTVKPGRWDDPWRDPISYSNGREGTNIDIGSGSEWHTFECCPRGYKVIATWSGGKKKQIKGTERYQDGFE